MELADIRKVLRESLTRFQPRADFILILLSFISIGLVFTSQFVNPLVMPVLSVRWQDLNIWLRVAIWMVFVVDYVVYAMISSNRLRYVKTHVLELMIVLLWLPASNGNLISSLGQGLVTVDLMQVLGTLAHGWRIVRWTARRFNSHPILVTLSAAILLISSTAALLNHFEPQSFPSFWDAAWYGLTTCATLGYGDYVPRTGLGRLIAVPLILGGISLYGVYLGTVVEWVSNRLLKKNGGVSPAHIESLRTELAESRKLQETVLEELRALRAERQKDKTQPPG